MSPVDMLGRLWLVRPEHGSTGTVVLRSAPHLHVSRDCDPHAAVSAMLWAGGSVGLFEDAARMGARLDRLAERLADVGQHVSYRCAYPSFASFPRIDDEQGALDWFLRDAADVLVVDRVTFEKRRGGRGGRHVTRFAARRS